MKTYRVCVTLSLSVYYTEDLTGIISNIKDLRSGLISLLKILVCLYSEPGLSGESKSETFLIPVEEIKGKESAARDF